MLRTIIAILGTVVAVILIMAAFNAVWAQDYDDEVTRSAQTELAKRGYKIDVDGVMGDDTRSIIRDFQRDNDLPVNGVLDVDTSAKLFGFTGNRRAYEDDRKAPAADDAPYQDRGRNAEEATAQCKPAALDETGTAAYVKSWAKSSTRHNWQRKVQARHGEIYADAENARVLTDDCHRVVVGRIPKWRCDFIAFPCRKGGQ